MRIRTTLAAVVVGTGAAAAPAQALKLRGCGGADGAAAGPGFGCATLTVPLDRSGALPGTVRLRVAVQTGRRARSRPGVLIALTGGPGQGGVAFARSFALGLDPLLGRHRLAVLDQRGTGRSGAINCPALQRLTSLDRITPESVAACAERTGPRSALYSTQDTVADIDALRRALGVRRIALMGISYGTFVAQQYARTHPDRVSRLILDSPIAGRPDAFLRDSLARIPRVLREQCRRRACRGITPDPVADVAALVARLSAGRPITGATYDRAGRRRTSSFTTGEEIFALLVAGDLNAYLQPALPGAIRAAVRGQPAALLRLRRIAAGPRLSLRDVSFGLFTLTTCADAALPYALSEPFSRRRALVDAAAARLTPAELGPFDAATATGAGPADDCLLFPAGPVTAPSEAPLPRVPALILGGRLDIRTPAENASDVTAELPTAQVVTVPGAGHDVLDTDMTGCVQTALRRFVRGRRVGNPCRGLSNEVPPYPVPPRTLRDYRRASGVAGNRGRTISAVLDAVADAQLSALQVAYAGFRGQPRGGGLHGGRFRETPAGTLILRGYQLLRGLSITGTLRSADTGDLVGRLRVRGSAGSRGVLRLRANGTVTGRLGGRGVRSRPSRSRAATAARAQAARSPLSLTGRLSRP